MLLRPSPKILMTGATLIAMIIRPGPVSAEILDEVIVYPTSSVVTLPTSSVLSTSYVVPTSYTSSIFPTSYSSSIFPTSYASTYLPTSTVLSSESVVYPTTTTYYRRSLLRPRRYIERTSYSSYYSTPTSTLLPTSYVVSSSIVPTSYLMPTTYVSSLLPTSYVVDNGLMATSYSPPCDTVAPPMKTATIRPSGNNSGPSIVSEPLNGGGSNERKPSATVNSTPSGEDPIPSTVSPPVPAPVNTAVPPKPISSTPGNLDQPGPVDAGALPNITPGNPNDQIKVPVPGSGGNTPPNETSYRNVRRPSYDVRNILRGRVISAESRETLEGVSVIATSPKGFVDRTAMTDAFGEFKLSLPDGDWVVKVKMPSGNVMAVREGYVTASNGRVIDQGGRPVGEYVINR